MTLSLLAVCVAAYVAGLLDAMVGGGGLITVPALFSSFPAVSPVLLLGTNKCSSVFGTLVAGWRYGRRMVLQWCWLLPAVGVAFAGALLGAWTLTVFDATLLRNLCPWLLSAILLYTVWQPDLGLQSGVATPYPRSGWLLLAGIGWYDGFFGPGTGSLFIFLLVRLLGMDFLQASAHAKVLNAATNLAALSWLAAHGQVWWQTGLWMALANVVGSLTGARLALRYGAGLVRSLFLLVVLALIVKTACDAYSVGTV